jgi:hypothetical protein
MYQRIYEVCMYVWSMYFTPWASWDLVASIPNWLVKMSIRVGLSWMRNCGCDKFSKWGKCPTFIHTDCKKCQEWSVLSKNKRENSKSWNVVVGAGAAQLSILRLCFCTRMQAGDSGFWCVIMPWTKAIECAHPGRIRLSTARYLV